MVLAALPVSSKETRMKPHPARTAILAALLVPALGMTEALAQRQDSQQGQQLARWSASRLYRDAWSAEEMIGTEVRGRRNEEIGKVKDILVRRDGTIDKVIVEVGGLLDIGDQHIGVPWKHVIIGPEMSYVRVRALKELEGGDFALYDGRKRQDAQGDSAADGEEAWRVNELIGDYADLRDLQRYGLVVDVVFSDKGHAQGVVIERGSGPWGPAGWYGYPYVTFERGPAGYRLPYETSEVRNYGRFDYIEFGRRSQYANDRSDRARQQARAAARSRQGAASAGAGTDATAPQAPPRPTQSGLRPWERGEPQEEAQPQDKGQPQEGPE